MAAGGHFEFFIFKSCVSKLRIESDFQSSKMAAGDHFVKKLKKKEVAHWSEMARNAIKSDFRSSKMAASYHFVKIIAKNLK